MEKIDDKKMLSMVVDYIDGKEIGMGINDLITLLEKQESEGSKKAAFYLGSIYEKGKDVQDYKKSFYWYEKAADKGFDKAQYKLGMAYKNGLGVEVDKKKAFDWFLKASAQKLSVAQYEIGNAYYYGEGTEKNEAYAATVWGEAAERNHVEAAKLAGKYYVEVSKNKSRAVKYYKIAAQQGDEESQEILDKIYSRYTKMGNIDAYALLSLIYSILAFLILGLLWCVIALVVALSSVHRSSNKISKNVSIASVVFGVLAVIKGIMYMAFIFM